MIAKGFCSLSQTRAESAPRHTQTWRQEATTRVFGALLVLCLMVAAVEAWVSPAADLTLRYERAAVLQGEYWRLITAHCTHADTQHLIFNLLGTGLIAALFPRSYAAGEWAVILLVSALTIDAGFLLFEPSLEWYVGASGVLHGSLVAGAIAWFRSGQRSMAAVLGIVLVSKLAWEQWQGELPLVTGVPVIVDAHAYGALGGAGGALLTLVWRRRIRRDGCTSL